MFTFAVFLLSTFFGSALSGYYFPEADSHLHAYQTEYAPEYNNYEPHDYKFEYAVSDPHTGDHKQQWEVKENGVVRGMYSLLEPDGTIRVVEYIADDHGFRATVKKLGTPIHTEHGHTHYHHQEQTHHHHVSLPEAFSAGYHGAYSGLAENYGISTLTTPITLHEAHELHAPVHVPVHVAEPVALHVHEPVSPHVAEPIHVAEPVHFAEHLHVATSLHVAEPVHVHVPEPFHVHVPEPVHLHVPVHIPVHTPSIHLGDHHASVEVHGFTGNNNDDSSWNYGHENVIESQAHLYHHPEVSHQTYFGHVHSESAPIPYKTSYSGKATSYVMQRQGNY